MTEIGFDKSDDLLSLRNPVDYSFSLRRRSALLTTLILEIAIAPAARIGLSWRRKLGAHSNGARIPAAIGIRAVL
ncbi:MAG: hypothetical protein GWN04_00430 [Gammaproteobacteria bacterium]|nr:hypothetical protein [Gammaproteobacteria bacterium]NIX16797.1 hypothetical protein [Gammaproteobacteria bacterium]